jgi:hypothetical protein
MKITAGFAFQYMNGVFVLVNPRTGKPLSIREERFLSEKIAEHFRNTRFYRGERTGDNLYVHDSAKGAIERYLTATGYLKGDRGTVSSRFLRGVL